MRKPSPGSVAPLGDGRARQERTYGRRVQPSGGNVYGGGGGGSGGGGSDEPPDEAARLAAEAKALKKHRAKRLNEQLKAAYGLTNALAAAVFVAGYIQPTILGQPLPYGLDTPGLLVIGCFLHAVGQGLLRIFTRREE